MSDLQETPVSILCRINRLRPALEAMRHVSLVLPLELDTVDAILAALDDAAAAGYLDAGVPLPDGQNPVAVATGQLTQETEAQRQ